MHPTDEARVWTRGAKPLSIKLIQTRDYLDAQDRALGARYQKLYAASFGPGWTEQIQELEEEFDLARAALVRLSEKLTRVQAYLEIHESQSVYSTSKHWNVG